MVSASSFGSVTAFSVASFWTLRCARLNLGLGLGSAAFVMSIGGDNFLVLAQVVDGGAESSLLDAWEVASSKAAGLAFDALALGFFSAFSLPFFSVVRGFCGAVGGGGGCGALADLDLVCAGISTVRTTTWRLVEGKGRGSSRVPRS